MNELSKFLVESIMEDENPIKKTVVIYVGRFQPFHKGHYGTYQHLVKKFGKDNVFIGTSDKVEKPKSPFNFKEKVKIMTTMFGIPTSKIHKVKNPYKPTEILQKFDEETTAFVTVVGEKDKNRLGGKYFQKWNGEPTVGYRDGGYVYAAPQSGGGISGTETRNGLSVGSDEQKKDFFKKRAYGKFNATIFKMITDRLDEGIEIPKEVIEEWLINESSAITSGQVDDGPNFFVPNYDTFQKISAKRAAKIGYEVVNMITSKEIEDYYEHPQYPNGPVKAVTPFPAGVLGTQTSTNQVDIYSSDAYTKWFTHVTRKAAMAGYELVKGLESTKDTKDASLDSQKGDKVAQSEYENSLQEAITLPVEIGDTLLMGKFKNKKVVVKSIGKDEHGMPTINGKKVVTFRLMKEGFVTELAGTAVRCEKCNHSWDIEEDDDEKYLCHSCGWDSQQQEYDYDAFESWAEKSGLFESIEERGGKLRPSQKLRRKAAMAGKGREIARKRKRTMMRRKPLDKLKKVAYKMAYRQVYDEFAEDLFPDIPKSQLSIQQSKVVHRNVLRKKKRVLKRARFRFLPDLRAKEAEKFTKKENNIEEVGVGTGQSGVRMGYPSKDDLKKIEKRVKNQRSNTDSNKEYQYDVVKEGIENSLQSKYKVDIDIYEYPTHLELRRIVVPQDKRGHGIGSKVMGDLIKYAKSNNKDLFTTPSSDFGGSKSRLVQFYKSFGFKDNKGSNRDFRSKESMVRLSEGKELEKLGIKDFKSLFKMMPSDLQKRVYNLKNFGQRLDKHPEGNVLKHTIVVVNRSLKDDDIDIAIAAMFHDIGKDETAGIHPKKGHITHFGHEKVSASLVSKYKDWIKSVGGNPANVLYIVKNHMRYKQLSDMRPHKQDKLKSFRAYDKLSKFSKHDRGGLDESKNLKLTIPSDIKKIHSAFKKNDKKLYVVGGAVRDAILGNSPKDFDLATDAKPDETLKIGKDAGFSSSENGKAFGVVIIGGHEIATFRKDIGKGRRPSAVDYTDIEGDVKRRDLTVNALFYDMDRNEIVDLVGGIADLKKKNIRTVGNAKERFDEDPLRKLRALRFQARLGGNFDKELLDALQNDSSLNGVSSERIRDEFVKSIKTAKDTKQYMELNDKIGFTSLIFPNLKITKPYIKNNDYIIFISSLLRKNSPSVLTKSLSNLKYTNDEKTDIVFLVSLQQFKPEEILNYKKLQQKTSLSDKQILEFGKSIGKDFKKFVNFKLSVSGSDVPSDIKGAQIGLWIKNKETENFLKK